ncbi:carboxypeptidase-like regulatory domain-containing protein [Hymenobacter actinosclerus]|uniref:Carboxypeptidase regulatory-like domain-containing protein n=1 Tax=Hymenobacter actinosclerus TaxID=82805 RepID=A0A1I0DUH1_9BACT|nr:carboxypeptidase-like regulatory domain-containing protein [Hymenobacter actinosclerus]SET35964.1 Carboxypeptidase regulatory-like domain-containing protein [Hymenobacter actinosclerus]
MRLSFITTGLLLLTLLVQQPAWSQLRLDGQVRDALTRQPLPFATVFLANTTYGTTTDSTGHFVLAGMPAGQYEFTVSYVGYELYTKALPLQQSTTLAPSLKPSASLSEVVIRPTKNRPADYRRFTKQFFGSSAFAQQCRIENPDDVVVVFDAAQQELAAIAPRQLAVINQALGYRITYHRFDFKVNYASSRLTFVAAPVFEELKGTNDQQQRWEANRRKAYAGSFPHFLRSVREDQIAQEGFLVQRLVTEPNSAPLQLRLKQASDSLAAVFTPASGVVAFVYKQALSAAQICQAESLAATGKVRFRSNSDLRVTYQGEQPDAQYVALTLAASHAALREAASNQLQPNLSAAVARKAQPNGPVLEVSDLRQLGPAAIIQPNGYLTNPLSVKLDGYWAFERVGEALPLDYSPAQLR